VLEPVVQRVRTPLLAVLPVLAAPLEPMLQLVHPVAVPAQQEHIQVAAHLPVPFVLQTLTPQLLVQLLLS